jgi:cytidyltransferase-like protein
MKKVLVAGFFDLFHSGHARFLEEASSYGKLSVVAGSDENSLINKGKRPVYTQKERCYILSSLKFVSKVLSPEDCTSLNFATFLEDHDIFIVNEDGHTEEKQNLCESKGVEYIVLKREPLTGLRENSSTSVKEQINLIPQRLDIVGFFDQKLLNSVYPGSVILANIKPIEAEERSGLSSSTTKVINKIFGPCLPKHLAPIELAKIVFAVENPPDRKYISGVVDQLGICLPGINRLHFKNEYFPSLVQEVPIEIRKWLSKYTYLKQTKPRPNGYEVFDGRENFKEGNVKNLSDLGSKVWNAIQNKDIINLGRFLNETHEAQKNMIPGYESDYSLNILKGIKNNHIGTKLMGAGGYGYAMVLTEKPEKDFIKVSIT